MNRKRFEIKFVKKRLDNSYPWHGVLRVGGYNSNGSIWDISEITARDVLNKGKMEFYIVHDSKEYDITARTNATGYEYLSCELDDEYNREYTIMHIRDFPVA